MLHEVLPQRAYRITGGAHMEAAGTGEGTATENDELRPKGPAG